MSPSILQISEVQCQKGGYALFAPVNFILRPGQLAVIAGNNGSGKTTLMEAIATLGSFSAGKLSFQPDNNTDAWLVDSHYLGHALGNKSSLNCLENLRFATQINGQNCSEDEMTDALDTAGLGGYEYHYASDLSAGQKKRLALSRLLILNKNYWLLDEPFVNLDAAGCDWLFAVINQHIIDGGAAILTAHDNKRIHQKADVIVTLERP